MNQSRGIFLILGAAILWGTTGTSQALMPAERSSLAVGALRLLIGGSCLLGLSIVRGKFCLKGLPSTRIALAGVCIALYQVCFFLGVSYTGVAAGTIVGIGSSPIFAGLLDWHFCGIRPQPRWYLSTAIAIAGCMLLVLSAGDIHIDPLGIILAMGAGLAYSAFTLVAKLIISRHPAENATALIFAVGALLTLPFLIFTNLDWLCQTRGWLPVVHLGVIATALSYWLFSRGLTLVPVSTAVTLSLAEPMTAALLGVFVLGERLPVFAWLGLIMILAALVVLAMPQKVQKL